MRDYPKGDFVPAVKEGDKIVPKPISQFTHEETKKGGLDSNEFNRVHACDIAKEVCDTLETRYEGPSQVREPKTNLYVH